MPDWSAAVRPERGIEPGKGHPAALGRPSAPTATTTAPRLARLGGVTGKEFRELVRVRFVKVAEYQSRGVVHFHSIIRLDANTDEDYAPPPGWSADLLAAAIKRAAAQASALAPVNGGRALLVRFGAIRPYTKIVRWHTADALTPLPWPTTSPSTPPNSRRRPRPAVLPAPLRDRGRSAPLPGPLPAADRDCLGARPPPVGAHASATAGTSSPNPAASPLPSASSVPPAKTTARPSATQPANSTPGAAR